MADPGEGPATPPPFLDQTEARRAEKIFLVTSPPQLSHDINYPPPPPPNPLLSEGLDLPLRQTDEIPQLTRKQ